MSWDDVQSILLRNAHATAVRHLIFRVAPRAWAKEDTREERQRRARNPRGTPGRGGDALGHLKRLLKATPLTVGDRAVEGLHCSLGFTYDGLEALGMPLKFLQLFARLAPAFRAGASARAAQLGDTGVSAPSGWEAAFRRENAHVLLTLHGTVAAIEAQMQAWERMEEELAGQRGKNGDDEGSPLLLVSDELLGQRLGAPSGKPGEWVHFGYRDGLVEHRIAGVPSLASHKPNVVIPHAPGEFLLGHRNDVGANRFHLPLAPDHVRKFFHNSSFGVLRKIEQDVHRFEQSVTRWLQDARAEVNTRNPDDKIRREWVKAKLCGRWPTGEPIQPGQDQAPPGKHPEDHEDPRDFVIDFAADQEATGCPWFSHVRRMDAQGHAGPTQRPRSLLRRGMPYGPPNWDGNPDTHSRGLLGLFFCASLEDQFELLVGQWSNGSPPGRPVTDAASDPLAGHHADPRAAAVVPLPGGRELLLTGFSDWTRTRGTVYTWHPRGDSLERILVQEYGDKDDEPWL